MEIKHVNDHGLSTINPLSQLGLMGYNPRDQKIERSSKGLLAFDLFLLTNPCLDLHAFVHQFLHYFYTTLHLNKKNLVLHTKGVK